MACRQYNTGRCLQLRLFNCPNFGVHFRTCPRDTTKTISKVKNELKGKAEAYGRAREH